MYCDVKRSRLLVLGLAAAVLLSSCSLLFRYREVAHKGLNADDFGLPVILYKSENPATKRMVILLSGDGGWLDFNDELAEEFSKKGYNTIGFNSRTYFWQQRTPAETSRDFNKLIAKYARLWKAKHIILSGYSFGADVIPFVYNRMPDNLKRHVSALQLMSPFLSTDFKVIFTDLIKTGKDNRTYKVKNEVARIRIPIYCFYGESEDPKPLINIRKKNFLTKLVKGGHEYVDAVPLIVSSLNIK
ncbi:hypothetical protein F1649_03415 [Arcticibacter tournemirensis]|uniref:Bacterial virulence domain-containing protein n=1 Tax=Arcticibacter tournemirensis TaxID=699437 RepID=A0A5M9HG65_9SPHI|nr:AcvB/VirJ family lysyl-phosphatidylglycerol hydrolase [Arcticibacter tournemirensis]KAA8485543.1 hypothetical protein F1649_03415 [Arcticibacter tournemirensis]